MICLVDAFRCCPRRPSIRLSHMLLPVMGKHHNPLQINLIRQFFFPDDEYGVQCHPTGRAFQLNLQCVFSALIGLEY